MKPRKVYWCTEHDASFQQEAIPGPPTWNCWSGPIEDEPCVPYEMELRRIDPSRGVVLSSGVALSLEQVEMIVQTLGDVLVASGISNVPLSGPELLAHAESLKELLDRDLYDPEVISRATDAAASVLFAPTLTNKLDLSKSVAVAVLDSLIPFSASKPERTET